MTDDHDTRLTCNEVCAVLGVHKSYLTRWLQRGYIAAIPGTSPREFKLVDILAAAVGLNIYRRSGGSGDLANAVCGAIASYSHDELVAAFAEGKRYLLAVGTMICPPSLLRRDVVEAAEVDLLAAQYLGTPTVIIDVESCYDTLVAAVADLRAKEAEAEEVTA